MQEAHEIQSNIIAPPIAYTVPVTHEDGQMVLHIPHSLGFDGVQAVKMEKRGDDIVISAVRPKRRPWTSLIGKLKVDIVPDRTPIGDPERFLKDFL